MRNSRTVPVGRVIRRQCVDHPTDQKGRDRLFPADPWSVLPPCLREQAVARLDAAAAAAIRRRGPPCDLALGRRYLEEHLPPGRCWVYGAGTHTDAILDILETREAVHLMGFVDRNAAQIGSFRGYETITAAELAHRDFDFILVGHLHYEEEFVQGLLETGVPGHKIVRVYGNPVYAEQGLRSFTERLMRDVPPNVNCVIISGRNLVVSDAELVAVLPPERTVVLYFGPDGHYRESVYPILDLRRSLSLMQAVLSRLSPDIVYLRTFFDDDCHTHIVRTLLPQAILIHEMFDISIVFPDEILFRWNKWSEDKLTTMRLAEHQSFRSSDLVVSKRGGECWERVTAPFDTPCITVFSRASVPKDGGLKDHGKAPPTDGAARIVYAGCLPADQQHLDGYYNLYPLFENLTADGDIKVDIFNGEHFSATHDDEFAEFLARNDGGRIRYHRALPYDRLVDTLASFHFGWLYNERSAVYIHDAAVTLPGRFTGYISAGVPVIVDDEFDYVASLVRRFNAGIVVPDGRTAMIPQMIRGADHGLLREGVRALRSFMIDHNRQMFDRLRRFVPETPRQAVHLQEPPEKQGRKNKEKRDE